MTLLSNVPPSQSPSPPPSFSPPTQSGPLETPQLTLTSITMELHSITGMKNLSLSNLFYMWVTIIILSFLLALRNPLLTTSVKSVAVLIEAVIDPFFYIIAPPVLIRFVHPHYYAKTFTNPKHIITYTVFAILLIAIRLLKHYGPAEYANEFRLLFGLILISVYTPALFLLYGREREKTDLHTPGAPITIASKYFFLPLTVLTLFGRNNPLMPTFSPTLERNKNSIIFVFGLIFGIYVIFFDKPDDKARRVDKNGKKHVIQKDGYYFGMFVYLLFVTGPSIGTGLGRFRGFNAIQRSLFLQVYSLLYIMAAQSVSRRTTDDRNFPVLLFATYFQVDLFQNFLYLQETEIGDNSVVQFMKLIFVQEIFGICKNSGITEFILFKLRLRSQSPYESKKGIQMLISKGVIEKISSTFCCVSACVIYIAEKMVLEWLDDIEVFNDNKKDEADASGDEQPQLWISFSSPPCTATCVGFNVELGVPPPEPHTVGYTCLLFLAILLIRSLCALIERRMLSMLFEKLGNIHVDSDMIVKPKQVKVMQVAPAPEQASDTPSIKSASSVIASPTSKNNSRLPIGISRSMSSSSSLRHDAAVLLSTSSKTFIFICVYFSILGSLVGLNWSIWASDKILVEFRGQLFQQV